MTSMREATFEGFTGLAETAAVVAAAAIAAAVVRAGVITVGGGMTVEAADSVGIVTMAVRKIELG